MHREGVFAARVEYVSLPPNVSTVGELKAAGYQHRTLRAEIRENLLAKLRAGEDPWPGLHGLDQTVIPQVERALIAGHDIVLLGERGQGKTRLLRSLVALLDDWIPIVAGSELREDPFAPITDATRERAEKEGDGLAVAWVARDDRYAETLLVALCARRSKRAISTPCA